MGMLGCVFYEEDECGIEIIHKKTLYSNERQNEQIIIGNQNEAQVWYCSRHRIHLGAVSFWRTKSASHNSVISLKWKLSVVEDAIKITNSDGDVWTVNTQISDGKKSEYSTRIHKFCWQISKVLGEYSRNICAPSPAVQFNEAQYISASHVHRGKIMCFQRQTKAVYVWLGVDKQDSFQFRE